MSDFMTILREREAPDWLRAFYCLVFLVTLAHAVVTENALTCCPPGYANNISTFVHCVQSAVGWTLVVIAIVEVTSVMVFMVPKVYYGIKEKGRAEGKVEGKEEGIAEGMEKGMGEGQGGRQSRRQSRSRLHPRRHARGDARRRRRLRNPPPRRRRHRPPQPQRQLAPTQTRARRQLSSAPAHLLHPAPSSPPKSPLRPSRLRAFASNSLRQHALTTSHQPLATSPRIPRKRRPRRALRPPAPFH